MNCLVVDGYVVKVHSTLTYSVIEKREVTFRDSPASDASEADKQLDRFRREACRRGRDNQQN